MLQGECLAKFVAIVAVAARGRKYAGQAWGLTFARDEASKATASASLTTRPVRRRSAGGNSAGVGSIVGAGE
jgi:hypothetical protein